MSNFKCQMTHIKCQISKLFQKNRNFKLWCQGSFALLRCFLFEDSFICKFACLQLHLAYCEAKLINKHVMVKIILPSEMMYLEIFLLQLEICFRSLQKIPKVLFFFAHWKYQRKKCRQISMEGFFQYTLSYMAPVDQFFFCKNVFK